MKPIKNDALLMRLSRALLRAVEKMLVTATYRKVDMAGPRRPRPSSGREPGLRVCRKFRRSDERNGHTLLTAGLTSRWALPNGATLWRYPAAFGSTTNLSRILRVRGSAEGKSERTPADTDMSTERSPWAGRKWDLPFIEGDEDINVMEGVLAMMSRIWRNYEVRVTVRIQWRA